MSSTWPDTGAVPAGIDRRRLVLSATACALAPGVLLTACGGGGGDTPQPDTPPAANPLVVLVRQATVGATTEALALPTQLTAVGRADDRFGGVQRCHRFDGTASAASAELPSGNVAADLAVSLWLRADAPRAGQVFAISSATPTGRLAAGYLASGQFAAWAEDAGLPLIVTTRAPGLADGGWHHLLLQQRAGRLTLFIDGIACGDAPGALSLAGGATLRLGGSTWAGDLDGVQIHNRSFDAADVPGQVFAWRPLKPYILTDFGGFYPFRANAVNETGHGLDGVLHNVVPTPDRFGQPDAAYAFNGRDAYIELSDAFDATIDDFALAIWLKTTSREPMAALSITPGAGTPALDLLVNLDHGVQLFLDGAAVDGLAWGSVGSLADGQWHLLLVQRQGPQVQLWTDAVLRAAVSLNLVVMGPGTRVRCGRDSGRLARPVGAWSGALDDLQFHERAFDADAVRALEGLQFTPRDGAGLLDFGGRAWLLGGWNPDQLPVTSSQVWSTADGADWQLVTRAPWEGRHSAGWLVHDGRMWVIGGDRSSGHYQNDVWSSADGQSWQRHTDSPPWSGRTLMLTASFSGRLWVMGGMQVFNPPDEEVAYQDVYSSADGAQWRLEASQAAWAARGNAVGSVVHDGWLWVIGGGRYDSRLAFHDVWRSADGAHWEQVLDQAPWTARQYHGLASFAGKMWVVAGSDTEHPEGTDDVWYSTDGRDWTRLAGSPWPARHAAGLTARSNGLWLAAGSSTRLFNDVWALGYAP